MISSPTRKRSIARWDCARHNINSWRIFSEHPLTGVGSGDFRDAYRDVNARHTPQWTPTHNPHSQYFLVLTTTGLMGGIVLLLVYLPPPLFRIPYHDGLDRLRVALPVLYLIISAFESYLWRTNTSLMFVLFSAMLYATPPGRFGNVSDENDHERHDTVPSTTAGPDGSADAFAGSRAATHLIVRTSAIKRSYSRRHWPPRCRLSAGPYLLAARTGLKNCSRPIRPSMALIGARRVAAVMACASLWRWRRWCVSCARSCDAALRPRADLQGLLKSGLLTWLSGAARRVD